jgi:hypothetical protein
MKINKSGKITNACWTLRNNKNNNSYYNFNVTDLNHNLNLYKEYSILPESLTQVKCDFLIQKTHLIRYMIKQLDMLLKIDGFFEITLIDSKFHSGFFLSRDQVKYEFGISTDGRYSLVEKEDYQGFLKLIFKKNKGYLNSGDSITNWTFGIPSGGKKDEWINELILSIVKQEIPNYQIIICGPYENKDFKKKYNIKILEDVVLNKDIRIPICHKKNRIIKSSSYENICILHDRFLLHENWFEKMKEYGNYFDYLCLPTQDINKNRFDVDWMEFAFPLSKRITRNKSLLYTKWSPHVIIQGGVLIGKRKLLNKHLMDERIHWEELEDMHFSKVAFLDGSLINIDKNNYFISRAINHISKRNSDNIWLKIKKDLLWFYALIKSFIVFNKMKRKFYR